MSRSAALFTTPMRTALHKDRAVAVLTYWFKSASSPVENFGLWFGGTPDIDSEITRTFHADLSAAEAGKYISWLAEPDTSLALCILLDQFSLNIYRDQPKGYEVSASAIPLAYTAIGRGYHLKVPEVMRMFFFLPLMHSEHLDDQVKCVELMQNSDFAVEHYDVVKRFGRFPGRNKVHGRDNTPEEEEYLKNGGVY